MTLDRPRTQRRKPKQARSRATSSAILEAASQILERRGPPGFNTNDVAERAGVSIGTLYQYFPDKHAILLALAEREAARPEPSTAERQKALLRALIAMIETLGQGLVAVRAPAEPRQSRPAKRRGSGESLRAWVEGLLTPQPAMAPLPIRRR
jgi:AcrR family transcriptional regulator